MPTVSIAFYPPLDALSWSSFRRIARSLNGYDASTGYKLKDEVQWSKGTPGIVARSVKVTVSIDPHHSWVVSGKERPDLLQHEKLHYVIAGLVGIELEGELRTLSAAAYPAFLLAHNDLRTRKIKRAKEIEKRYDDDTKHSQVASQQSMWAMRVAQWRRAGTISWP